LTCETKKFIQNPVVRQVFVLIAFIVAVIASAKMAKYGGQGQAASFCAVWTALLLIAISIVGSVVMRRVSLGDSTISVVVTLH
jgi:hypothetical protein